MEKRRVPNNVTLAGLRRLLEALKERAGKDAVVNVTLTLWSHGNIESEEYQHREELGVYVNRTGTGTKFFTSLKEAHDYIKTLEKGGD